MCKDWSLILLVLHPQLNGRTFLLPRIDQRKEKKVSFDGSLAFWTREQTGQLSLAQIALIIRKTAYTVQELHNQQSIYQDLNPNTILLSLDGKNIEQMMVHMASPGVSARPSPGPNRSV